MKAQFYSSRFFSVMNEGIFVQLREGTVGPFLTKKMASFWLDMFLLSFGKPRND